MSLGHKGRLANNRTKFAADEECKEGIEEIHHSTTVTTTPARTAATNSIAPKDNDHNRNNQQAANPQMVRAGIMVMVLGAVLLFGAFGFAAQSLLAALGAVQFISNVLFSHFVLGYDITFRIFAATMTIVVGEVLVVVFSNHVSTQYEVSDLQHFYSYIDYQVIATFIWNLNQIININACLYSWHRSSS
jgi:hypothetical protein